jgi:hypothetical protein
MSSYQERADYLHRLLATERNTGQNRWNTLLSPLHSLWEKYHSDVEMIENPNIDYGYTYQDYLQFAPVIGFLLENVVQAGLLPPNELMNQQGHFKDDEGSSLLDQYIYDLLFERQVFRNTERPLEACVIGGHEGAILHELGMNVTTFDPYKPLIDFLPPPLTHLGLSHTKYAEEFNPNDVDPHNSVEKYGLRNAFDVVLVNNVIAEGSSLEYSSSNLVTACIEITKPGGINILAGDRVAQTLLTLQSTSQLQNTRFLRIASLYEEDSIFNYFTLHALQKTS